jgi:hypothetical protein
MSLQEVVSWDGVIGVTCGVGAPAIMLWAISSSSKRVEARIAKAKAVLMMVGNWLTTSKENAVQMLGDVKLRLR